MIFPGWKVSTHFEAQQKANEAIRRQFDRYKYSHPDGLATSWYENGKTQKEIQYKDGKLISQKEF